MGGSYMVSCNLYGHAFARTCLPKHIDQGLQALQLVAKLFTGSPLSQGTARVGSFTWGLSLLLSQLLCEPCSVSFWPFSYHAILDTLTAHHEDLFMMQEMSLMILHCQLIGKNNNLSLSSWLWGNICNCRAYDRAAQKLRPWNSHLNFPDTDYSQDDFLRVR